MLVSVDAGEVLGAGLNLSDEVGDVVLLPDAFFILIGGGWGGREERVSEGRGDRHGMTRE